jgi:hypothetical protein
VKVKMMTFGLFVNSRVQKSQQFMLGFWL